VRVLIALGGNAMTAPGGRATPEDQIAAIGLAARRIASVVADGHEVAITHGNGPQVGNLLVKNEIAASVVPPVPLDWCGAQTQGTIGFVLLNALQRSLTEIGAARPVGAVVTRTLVDAGDPAFARPTKPIGRYLTADEAAVMIGHGQAWEDRGDPGWRRVVASPEPIEVLDAPAVATLLSAGFVVVGAGGGGVPVAQDEDGTLRGVEAVIDKDLAAAVLARSLGVDVLVIATDVDHVALDFGTPAQRPLGRLSVTDLRERARAGHFASGSMGPKVEAACRFVESGGRRTVITSLDRITGAVAGTAGTVVEP
jgi:carbamate kinase